MKNVRTIVLLACLCAYVSGKAQLSTNEKPFSFDKNLKQIGDSNRTVQTITMPTLDMAKIEAEDEEEKRKESLPRYGYPHEVNYDLTNSGTWYELPNGDKLWQLNVVCPGALTVNFCYDKFWIPEGGKFFIYSKDKKHIIGAFTSRNNKGDRENVRGFATELLAGSDVMLEYYQPKEVTSDAIISINRIVHGYRDIGIGTRDFGDSGSCQVNVNCSEGQNWQREKKAVAVIVSSYYGRVASGSLLNTTDLGQKPFFLTAYHVTSYFGKYADSNSDMSEFLFYWNYETPGCANVNIEPAYYSTVGGTLVADYYDSDFALIRLAEDPMELTNFTPYYLGWDRSGQSGNPGVCIHHPKCDVKKISTVASQPLSTDYLQYTESSNATHWKVTWNSTANGHGTTEKGSSGSPLLTAAHKVIGQLHGGESNCTNLYSPDWYGKISKSWTGDNNIYHRLDSRLDSIGTGQETLEGLLVIPSTSTMTTDEQLYSNIRITSTGQLTIESEIELMGNSCVIVESGGKLIIDGGTLSNVEIVLKPGAYLEVINNGIIETRNGFAAPVGAVVDIEYGKIL